MGDHETATPRPGVPFVLSPDEDRVVRAVLAALRRIRHGSVQVLVQDGAVVQIDTVEKTRMTGGRS